MKQDSPPPVVIIGAGLAGLSCAVELQRRGIACQILEATDRVGGRVRSDVVDGFTLDHGFQVLLTAYPACRDWLDYAKLRLRPFEPGALVRYRGEFATLGDPWRRPSQALKTALSPVGSWGDKLRVLSLRRAAAQGTLDDLYHRPAEPTIDRLRRIGFSEPFIDQFFRPFLGGVFLDPSLQTSSRMLEFVFRMFAAGDIALPAEGMAAIPRQLAERLPRGTIRLRQTVDSIRDGILYLTGGESLQPASIVVATESTAAAELLQLPALATTWNQTVNHYFAAPQSPDRRKMLMLAGDEYASATAPATADGRPGSPGSGSSGQGPIGTVVVLSDIAPEYAPAGQSLISVSTTQAAEWDVSGAPLEPVRQQLQRWFGPAAASWRHLRSYSVPYALPVRPLDEIFPQLRQGPLFVCGDYMETPSIQGAMNSGLRVARLVAER